MGDFKGVVVKLAVEGGDEGDVEFFGDAQSFSAGGERALGMDDVERDGFKLFIIFWADPRNADTMKFGRDFETGGKNRVDRIDILCLRMARRNIINSVAEFLELFAISEGDASHAIKVWRKSITKLPDNHCCAISFWFYVIDVQ